jgi:hypothetical protein
MAGEEIAAHVCLCPVTYRLPGGRQITGSHFIDWAAGRRVAGAGGLLVRKLASLFDVLLAIGGSDDTQQVLPKLGFQLKGKIERQRSGPARRSPLSIPAMKRCSKRLSRSRLLNGRRR